MRLEFELTAEHERFRHELCEFLQEECDAQTREEHVDHGEQGGWSVEYRREFKRRLGAAGFIGAGWPERYGGGGKDMLYEVIFAEELEYHGAPGVGEPSLSYVPYALIAFASEEQKAQFLPGLRRGELTVFLGYTEPEAGSDLAALGTKAEPEGDEFVITGQKVFSSYAHFSDYGLVAARTDDSGKRHEGISIFLVDLTLPGIELSEHETVSGAHHPSVFFDHVRVPGSMLVGELNQGWGILMGAIDFERAALAAPGMADRLLDRLVANLDQLPGAQGGAAGDRLVSLAVEAEAARLYSYAIAHAHARGERPQHETSVSVLMKREAVRRLDVDGLELAAQLGPLSGGGDGALLAGALEHDYRDRIFYSFAAGGFDITRNVIASRGLRAGR